MQVCNKLLLFLIVLIVEIIRSETNFCNNENIKCNRNEVKSPGSETDNIKKYFNDLCQRCDSKIDNIKGDIDNINNALQDGTCSNFAKEDNVSKSETVPSLYDNLWMIIQRRQDGFINFNRNWYNYKQGFGNRFREFFMGLDKIHYLTNSARHELFIRLEDFKGNINYAFYDEFVVGNETEKYQLKKLGNYSGNAGDYLRIHEGMYFSTKNVDNDASDTLHCAKLYHGGWWYNNCMTSNLNGPFRTRYALNNFNITWGPKNYTQNKIVQMMIRLKP